MSPPASFGTYRVLHQIGSGVLGPVFRGYDSQQDRLVAIKTIKLDLIPEVAAQLAERLRAFTTTVPSHPAIIRTVDAGLNGSTPFIALEYAGGDSLDVVNRQTRVWTLERALPVLRELAEAIDTSWARGVGHGALHPRDVFVATGPADLQVTGFGIGQALDAVGARVPVRRPDSAPERVSGAAWDIRADVYSLAVVAHEMLSGHRPVGLDHDVEGVVAELSEDRRALVRKALAMAMAEAPADRYSSARDFVAALTAAGGGKAHAPVAAVQSTEPSMEPAPSRATADRPVDRVEAPVAAPIDLAAPVSAPPAIAAIEPAPAAPSLVLPRPGKVPASRSRSIDMDRVPVAPRHAVADGDEAAPSPFPWAATLAVFAAGLVLGGVVFYQIGWNRGNLAAAPIVANGTTVAVPPPPATTATVTPVSPGAAPAPSVASAPAPTARLVIQSTPSGALVTIDGQRAGETPLTLTVPLGRHDIQIARSGYVPRIERIDVTAKPATRTLRVQLRRGADRWPQAAWEAPGVVR